MERMTGDAPDREAEGRGPSLAGQVSPAKSGVSPDLKFGPW